MGYAPQMGYAIGQVLSGTYAARPAFGVTDRYYWATDIYVMFRDTGAAWEVASPVRYMRYLTSPWGFADVSLAMATAIVYLSPIEVPYTMTVDRICAPWYTPVAGNVKATIYRDAGDTPQGGAVVVSAGSVAKTGTYRKQEILIADTQLLPGLYWIGLVSDEATTMPTCFGPSQLGSGAVNGHSYDLVAYANAFTDPCPAVAAAGYVPSCFFRVKSVP
jgi:hypothetical protein